MRFIRQYKRCLVLLLTAFALLVTLASTATPVSALTWELPDREMMENPDGTKPNGGVMIEIAQTGSDIFLDANSSWAKVYYEPGVPDVAVQLYSGTFACGSGTRDIFCNDPAAVNYNFYYADPALEASNPQPTPFYSINSADLDQGNYGWQTVPGAFPLPPGGPVDTGAGMKYVIYVEAIWNGGSAKPGTGRINAFKVATVYAGGLTGYWGGPGNATSGPLGLAYALQERSKPDDTEETIAVEFATSCAALPPSQKYLKWRDADAAPGGTPNDGGEFPGDDPISFELIETNIDGSNPTPIISVGSADIGSDGEYKEIPFTARTDKKYIWRWYNVNKNNGIQLWMPFDTFYFGKTCSPPVSGNGNVQGRVFNDTNNNGVHDSGEQIIENPGVSGCTYPDRRALADVVISAPGGSSTPNLCGPAAFNAALYKISTPVGNNITVTLDPPDGWISTNGTTRTGITVTAGNDTDVGPWFGIREVKQGVQGRVFIDDNNNGSFDGADRIIKNPASACTGPNVYVPNVTVTATTAPGSPTGDLSVCNGPFAAEPLMQGPGTYSLYLIPTPSGNQTVRVNLPLDWVPNWKGITRNYYVPPNEMGGPNSVHDYFGILPRAPDIARYCSNSESLAQINWPSAGLSVSGGYYVDISTSSTFSTYQNKHVPAGTSIGNVPVGFSPGPIGPKLAENTTYYMRIYYLGPNVHSAVQTFTSDSCPRLTCGTLTPTDVESMDPVDMRASFTNIGQGQLAASANLGVSYSGTPNYSNANTAYTQRPLPGNNTTAISDPGAIAFSQPAGMYTVTWTVTGDSRSNSLTGPTACSANVRVSDKPYLRAYGGDVVVGLSQPPGTLTCPGWNSVAGSSINTFSKTTGQGAGVQLAAFALGQIEGFNTTSGQTAAAPPGPTGLGSFPKGLAFANRGTGFGGSANGGGSELPWCPPDYFASHPDTPASGAFLQALITPLFGMDSNSYYYDATAPPPSPLDPLYQFKLNNSVFKATCLPLLPCNNLGSDDKIAIYVKGDVIIDGDITYDLANWSVGNIPSLYVIAQGNIYIQPGVNQIDGVYIAQDDGSGNKGRIYTCADGKNVPTQAFMVANCRRKLTVNGTLIAQRLRLFRLNNSRLQSTPQELSSSPTIAEMVSFGAETWLTVPAPYPPSTIDGYDAATSLPPTL